MFTSDSSSEINITSSAVKSLNEIFPSASGGNETNESDISVESNVEMDQRKKVEDLEARLLRSEKELAILQKRNKELERKITENEQHHEAMSSRLFCLDRFKFYTHVNFYTGLPNYATLITSFEFLNPGEDCENIRSRISSDIPEEFYNSESDDEENALTTKKGRRRKLRPLEKFFIVLCRLRRGFSERHPANLYGVAQSTVSRIFIQWINFMYLKFGQICIWPSKAVVQQTMPLDFKEKFPTTRVIIDSTEVFCEMPSSLLLNSELFSSYKNHVTLKGRWNFSNWCHHFCEPIIHRQYFQQGNCCAKWATVKHLMMVTQSWLTKDFRFKIFCPWVLPLTSHHLSEETAKCQRKM